MLSRNLGELISCQSTKALRQKKKKILKIPLSSKFDSAISNCCGLRAKAWNLNCINQVFLCKLTKGKSKHISYFYKELNLALGSRYPALYFSNKRWYNIMILTIE